MSKVNKEKSVKISQHADQTYEKILRNKYERVAVGIQMSILYNDYIGLFVLYWPSNAQ